MFSVKGITKVNQFDSSVGCQQDVVTFDVTMDNTVVVQMLETLLSWETEKLINDYCTLLVICHKVNQYKLYIKKLPAVQKQGHLSCQTDPAEKKPSLNIKEWAFLPRGHCIRCMR